MLKLLAEPPDFAQKQELFPKAAPGMDPLCTHSRAAARLLLHKQEKYRTAPGHLSTHQQVTDTQKKHLSVNMRGEVGLVFAFLFFSFL